MRLHSIALMLGLGGLCVPPAFTQAVPAYKGIEHSTAWPASLNDPGRFGRGDAGQFTPGARLDVVQLDGARAVILAEPDLGFAPTALPQPVNDVATLRAGAPTGRDAVALVSAAGLELCWYDDASAGLAFLSVAAGPWAGAGTVRTADIDASGRDDVVGVKPDGVSVLTRLAGPTWGCFVGGPGFQTQAPVNELVLLQWDADIDLEIAVLTDLGVEVFDLDGTSLRQFSAALPGGALCRIGQQSAARDRLVWITQFAPPAQQLLMTLSPLGVDDLVDLGALDAFAAVPTDYDNDGDDDVLISHRYSYDLLWIENQRSPSSPAGPSFVQDPGQMKVFQVGSTAQVAPENGATPVVADLDGDGDDDVFFAGERTDDVTVFRGEAVCEDDLRAEIVAGVFTIDWVAAHGILDLTITDPVTTLPGATHLQVDLWRQADINAVIDPIAISRQELPMPASWPTQVSVVIPELDAEFDRIYHVQVHVVGLDGGGQTVSSFPASQGSFALKKVDRAALDADEPAGPSFDVPAPTPHTSGLQLFESKWKGPRWPV